MADNFYLPAISQLNSISSSLLNPSLVGADAMQNRELVRDQFLSIFLKEIIKQSFKTGFEENEENDALSMPMINNDILIDKLSAQLTEQFRKELPDF